MTDLTKPIRVSLDLDHDLYVQLTKWTAEAASKAGYRTRIPISVALRTCVQLLTTWDALQDAVVTQLLED